MEEIRIGLSSAAGWILCCACWINAPKDARLPAFLGGALGGIALGLALTLA